jgi:hypothetical protein
LPVTAVDYERTSETQVHFEVATSDSRDTASPVYVVSCEVTEEACRRLWDIIDEEFWCPLKTKYPWQPEPGSDYFRLNWRPNASPVEQADLQAFLATIPRILTQSYDIGTPQARTEVVQGPNPYLVHRSTDFPSCPSIANPENPPTNP